MLYQLYTKFASASEKSQLTTVVKFHPNRERLFRCLVNSPSKRNQGVSHPMKQHCLVILNRFINDPIPSRLRRSPCNKPCMFQSRVVRLHGLHGLHGASSSGAVCYLTATCTRFSVRGTTWHIFCGAGKRGFGRLFNLGRTYSLSLTFGLSAEFKVYQSLALYSQIFSQIRMRQIYMRRRQLFAVTKLIFLKCLGTI